MASMKIHQSQDVIMAGLEEASDVLLQGALEKTMEGDYKAMSILTGIASGVRLSMLLVATGKYDRATIKAVVNKLQPPNNA